MQRGTPTRGSGTGHSPLDVHVSPSNTGFESQRRRPRLASPPAGALLRHLEIPRSRGDTPSASRVPEIVVTRYWRVDSRVGGMTTSGGPGYQARRRERERQRRQHVQGAGAKEPLSAPTPAEVGGRDRRTAATTCGWCGGPITPRSPRTDPQVVFGHLPASSLGTGTGSGLRASRRPGRRKTGRGPGLGCAYSSRLANAAERARGPTGRRSRVRPCSPRTGEGDGAGAEDLPAPRPIQQCPGPVLTNGLQSSSSRDGTR